ncbi:MerR family transcriptional regulator [Streptomyces sp. NPDC059452]|uniref:MerR family transcriptional regulator n=1 Tax=Streptomyces sp. NPDC059452 TaxID=3346835 RepID=UPI0036CB237B
MRMGEFSRRTGVSQRSLRYYEEQGLLQPARRPSGYREYGEADVVAVRGIRMLLAAGLNTATIAELLPCMVDEDRILEPACSSALPFLDRERERIDEAVTGLLAARDRLDALIESTAVAGVTDEEACAAVSGLAKGRTGTGGSRAVRT